MMLCSLWCKGVRGYRFWKLTERGGPGFGQFIISLFFCTVCISYRWIHAVNFFLNAVDGYKVCSARWCSVVYCTEIYPKEATEQKPGYTSKHFSLMYATLFLSQM